MALLMVYILGSYYVVMLQALCVLKQSGFKAVVKKCFHSTHLGVVLGGEAL